LMVLEGRLIASWGLFVLFNKCPGVFLLKLVCLTDILIFALQWGGTFIIWNSPFLQVLHHNFLQLQGTKTE